MPRPGSDGSAGLRKDGSWLPSGLSRTTSVAGCPSPAATTTLPSRLGTSDRPVRCRPLSGRSVPSRPRATDAGAWRRRRVLERPVGERIG